MPGSFWYHPPVRVDSVDKFRSEEFRRPSCVVEAAWCKAGARPVQPAKALPGTTGKARVIRGEECTAFSGF